MSSRFAGKVALVTGAGSGIGRAAAELLDTESCCVGVLDINSQAANETADANAATGGHAIALVADVAASDGGWERAPSCERQARRLLGRRRPASRCVGW